MTTQEYIVQMRLSKIMRGADAEVYLRRRTREFEEKHNMNNYN